MTDDKSEQIKLVVFIKRRGGSVTTHEVTQYYWPLKNQRVEALLGRRVLSSARVAAIKAGFI